MGKFPGKVRWHHWIFGHPRFRQPIYSMYYILYIYIINTYTYIHIHIIYIYTLYMGINLKVQGRSNYCDDRSCLVVMVVGVFLTKKRWSDLTTLNHPCLNKRDLLWTRHYQLAESRYHPDMMLGWWLLLGIRLSHGDPPTTNWFIQIPCSGSINLLNRSDQPT